MSDMMILKQISARTIQQHTKDRKTRLTVTHIEYSSEIAICITALFFSLVGVFCSELQPPGINKNVCKNERPGYTFFSLMI